MLDGNFGDYNAISCLSLYVFTKKLRLPTCNLFSDLMLVYKLYMSDIRFIVRRICLALIFIIFIVNSCLYYTACYHKWKQTVPNKLKGKVSLLLMARN